MACEAVTQNLLTGAVPGRCDICFRDTGNLAMHRPACAREHGRLPLAVAVSEREEELILRAGLHSAAPSSLPETERLGRGVSDLDVARLVHQIERGNIIYPSRSHQTWRSTGPMAKTRRSLTTVVSEALRLGIVHIVTDHTSPHTYRTRLAAAITHARRRGTVNQPACGVLVVKPVRWRLLGTEQLAFVDCQACMDIPMSCIEPGK